MSKLITRGGTALVLAASLFLAPACTDEGSGVSEETVGKLVDQVKEAQRLNEQIVQNLKTGILLVYASDLVRVMNMSSRSTISGVVHVDGFVEVGGAFR